MASIKDYHYMRPSLTQSRCHNSLTSKNGGDLSPMDLDFSSVMNLSNSNEPAQMERPFSNNHQHHHQQQPQQSLPAISQVSRNSSFRLPSIASLISGGPSHSVSREDQLVASLSTSHPYSNATTHTPLHLPRLDYLVNRPPLLSSHSSSSVSSSEQTVHQPDFGPLHSPFAVATSRNSSLITMPCENNDSNNMESYATPSSAPPPTTESMMDTSTTATPGKKGRRTRKPKFISRVLNTNIQWSTSCNNNNKKNSNNNNSKNNEGMAFRPYQYEYRRLSHQQQQPQKQLQQEGRRQRISSVGTASSSVASSSNTIIDSSPSSSTAPSVISNSSAKMVKPRWQETERMDLLKAIVKEKQLDDMTSFSWDRISVAVGRAKKACKDQFRREILPALMDRLK